MNKRTILFADNQKEFLLARKEFLELAGYEVITADNPAQVQTILQKGKVDLAVLDIRMIDDSDEFDTSGLELAKKIDNSIPKIMLTGFPTWKDVRESLGKDLTGLSPAIDFIAKQEGPEVLLMAVDMALNRSLLKKNILEAFHTTSSLDLHDQLANIDPHETAIRMQKVFDRTARELQQSRKRENDRAMAYHKLAMWMVVLGVVLLALGILLAYAGLISSVELPAIGGILTQVISLLVFRREDKAYKRADDLLQKLEELNKLGSLLSICDTIVDTSKRENCKIEIIAELRQKWFG